MQVSAVSTRAFRNLCDPNLALHPRLNLIYGDNAQGKTNLLEALHLLIYHRSFRAQRLHELIRFSDASASIGGDLSRNGLQSRVEVLIDAKGRRTRIDGKVTTAQKHRITAVLFRPEDLQIPRGGAADRRRLVDQAIAAIWPGYDRLCADYRRTLQNRNRLLKETPPHLQDLLDAFDQQLSRLGGKIVAARLRYIRAIIDPFVRALTEISPADGSGVQICYCATQAPEDERDPEKLAQWLLGQLRSRHAEDLRRRATTAGPHADDIDFTLDGRSARSFASQGQLRSLVLAFKIAQLLHAHEVSSDYPVLLLDDVSSELDPHRSRYLFSFLAQFAAQVFVTSTRPELLPLCEERADFHVVSGEIQPVKRFTTT